MWWSWASTRVGAHLQRVSAAVVENTFVMWCSCAALSGAGAGWRAGGRAVCCILAMLLLRAQRCWHLCPTTSRHLQPMAWFRTRGAAVEGQHIACWVLHQKKTFCRFLQGTEFVTCRATCPAQQLLEQGMLAVGLPKHPSPRAPCGAPARGAGVPLGPAQVPGRGWALQQVIRSTGEVSSPFKLLCRGTAGKPFVPARSNSSTEQQWFHSPALRCWLLLLCKEHPPSLCCPYG